jgi:hypothetical protein
MSALRYANGNARPGARHAVEVRSVLGLPTLRPAFLVHVFAAAGSRESETGPRACIVTTVTFADISGEAMVRLDDDAEDDFDDEDDDDDDENEDNEEDDEPDEDEPETWQVIGFPLRDGHGLTSGFELPRLAAVFQLSETLEATQSARRPRHGFGVEGAPVTG